MKKMLLVLALLLISSSAFAYDEGHESEDGMGFKDGFSVWGPNGTSSYCQERSGDIYCD